jgi:hypothetical protein
MTHNEELLLDGKRYQYLRLLANITDDKIINLNFQHLKNDDWDSGQDVYTDFDCAVDEQLAEFVRLVELQNIKNQIEKSLFNK